MTLRHRAAQRSQAASAPDRGAPAVIFGGPQLDWTTDQRTQPELHRSHPPWPRLSPTRRSRSLSPRKRRADQAGGRQPIDAESTYERSERNVVDLEAGPDPEDWAELREGVPALAPLHRIASPDDIADACLGVITSTYATGQVFLVDGGLGLMI